MWRTGADGKGRLDWPTIFQGIQAAVGLGTLLLGLWLVKFSPISERLEESLRADAALAKRELVSAKDAVDTMQKTHSKLSTEVAAMEAQLSALRSERAAYAQSAQTMATTKYLVMVRYEFELLERIAEICARYGEHRQWLVAQRELAKIKDTPGYFERFDEAPKFPNFWLGIPSEPDLMPTNEQIGLSGLALEILRADDEEKTHEIVLKWLTEHIVDVDSTRRMTAAQFIEHTKGYSFLNDLLPQERNQLFAKIDEFLMRHPELRDLQINATTGANPNPMEIIASGKRHLPSVQRLRHLFLAHLKVVGIDVTSSGMAVETGSTRAP